MTELHPALWSATCRLCGKRVFRLEAPLHVEDHIQAGDTLKGVDRAEQEAVRVQVVGLHAV